VAGGRGRTSAERCDNGRRCTALGGVRADLRRWQPRASIVVA
jgi:hypothetical protein